MSAAQAEFPPQPSNGTYFAWGTPAFYRQHRALDGYVQVALRFHHGSRDWPAVQRELSKNPSSKPVEATLLSAQSVNTQRSIRPQAVALWLLAGLFGVIGLFVSARAGEEEARRCDEHSGHQGSPANRARRNVGWHDTPPSQF